MKEKILCRKSEALSVTVFAKAFAQNFNFKFFKIHGLGISFRRLRIKKKSLVQVPITLNYLKLWED